MNKEEAKQPKVKLKPWPELYLLDPVTGELPKNYKLLIANSKAKPSIANCETQNQSSCTRKTENIKLRRMPELEFLDPVTGECPKNVKELIKAKQTQALKPNTPSDSSSAQEAYNFVAKVLEKNASKKASAKKRLSTNLEFKVSNLESKESLPSTASHSEYENTNNSSYSRKKIIRKALFKYDRRSSLRKNSVGTGKLVKSDKTKVDETLPLLDIEETEQMLLNPTQKLKPTITSVFQKPVAIPPKKPKLAMNSSKVSKTTSRSASTSSTHSSLEEFLQFEAQCKTPKTQGKTSAISKTDISTYVKNIVAKINENQRLYEEMGKNMTDIKQNMDVILNHLDIKDSNLIRNIENMISFDENIAPNGRVTPARSVKGKSLRIATLQKTIEKKVLFKLSESPSVKTNGNRSESKKTLIDTPNTMCRIVRKKAEDQYLRLQDTPKVRR